MIYVQGINLMQLLLDVLFGRRILAFPRVRVSEKAIDKWRVQFLVW